MTNELVPIDQLVASESGINPTDNISVISSFIKAQLEKLQATTKNHLDKIDVSSLDFSKEKDRKLLTGFARKIGSFKQKIAKELNERKKILEKDGKELAQVIKAFNESCNDVISMVKEPYDLYKKEQEEKQRAYQDALFELNSYSKSVDEGGKLFPNLNVNNIQSLANSLNAIEITDDQYMADELRKAKSDSIAHLADLLESTQRHINEEQATLLIKKIDSIKQFRQQKTPDNPNGRILGVMSLDSIKILINELHSKEIQDSDYLDKYDAAVQEKQESLDYLNQLKQKAEIDLDADASKEREAKEKALRDKIELIASYQKTVEEGGKLENATCLKDAQQKINKYQKSLAKLNLVDSDAEYGSLANEASSVISSTIKAMKNHIVSLNVAIKDFQQQENIKKQLSLLDKISNVPISTVQTIKAAIDQIHTQDTQGNLNLIAKQKIEKLTNLNAALTQAKIEEAEKRKKASDIPIEKLKKIAQNIRYSLLNQNKFAITKEKAEITAIALCKTLQFGVSLKGLDIVVHSSDSSNDTKEPNQEN